MPKYFIGGATWILLIGLLGSTVYNGVWDDDNKWVNRRFGRQQTTHNLAVATIVFSLFAFLAVLGALLVSIFLQALKLVELICWGTGYFLTLIVIILQGCALTYTVYGSYVVQDQYNYLDQYPDFKSYVETHDTPDTYLFSFHFGVINDIRGWNGASRLEGSWFDIGSLEAFFVVYRKKIEEGSEYGSGRVASCAFNWTMIALSDKLSGEPCSFTIEDGDAAACIGGWSGRSFRDYWCYLWNEKKSNEDFLKTGPSVADIQKREQARLRNDRVVDSVPAFYRHNTYFIGINVAGAVVSAGAVALDFFLARSKPQEGGGEKQKAAKPSKTDNPEKSVEEAKPDEAAAPDEDDDPAI